ncbi:MAG: ferredoxin [Peptoniphilus sp.]|nr:ferredoxin [Peptoniphilus sp.]
MIKRIVKFYFTGTDTTKKVVDAFVDTAAKDLNVDEIYDFNYTLPEARKNAPKFGEGDLVVSGVPTIAGRVPNLLLPYLNTLEGQGALGVAISMYGNRNFDDCLVEQRDLLQKGGVKVVGAGAFIGEHSFSTILGATRPDDADLKVVEEFAHKTAEKIAKGDYSEPEVKGEVPYRPYYTPRDRKGNLINFVKIKPETDVALCIDCKICAESCPLGSIDYDDTSKIPGKCMKCCACIKKCPTGAKYFADEGYNFHREELEIQYAENRCEPEYFL